MHAPATVNEVTGSQALEGDCEWVWCAGLIGQVGSNMAHGGCSTSADALLLGVPGLSGSLLSNRGRTWCASLPRRCRAMAMAAGEGFSHNGQGPVCTDEIGNTAMTS